MHVAGTFDCHAGQLIKACDVYSFGVLLWEMFTGMLLVLLQQMLKH